MRLSIYLFSAIILLLLFNACEENNQLETIDELTVEAFLLAGNSIDSVKFGKVIPLDSSEAEALTEVLNPIIIGEDNELISLFDTGEEGIYNNSEVIIQENNAYRLEVEYNGKLITAETYIPSQPTGIQISDTLIFRSKIRDFTDLQNQDMPDPIELSWDEEPGAYFFVHVQNIEDDPEPVNALFSGDFPRRPNILTEPSSSASYNIDTFQEITYFGRYEVVIYRVNPEYVALYEDNTSGTGNLNEVRTNVQNGFGIFTGINCAKIYFEVKEQ